MYDHPQTLFVYRCAEGHTLFRRTRAESNCNRCGDEGPPDKSDRYEYLLNEIVFSEMIDFAEAVETAENRTLQLEGIPMKYIGSVEWKENEPEAVHACRAVELKESTIN